MRLVTMKFSASQTTAKVVDQLCAGLGCNPSDDFPGSRSASVPENYGAAAETPNEFPLSSLRSLRCGLSGSGHRSCSTTLNG